jgi:DNA replication protein DnaC
MGKRAKSNIATAEPEFEPTPEFSRLEQEVARRKQRDLERGVEPGQYRGKDPQPLSADIAAFRKRYGITAESSKECARETAEIEAAAVRELHKRQKEGRWRTLCPAKFREPFNIDLIPASVDRVKIREVLAWTFSPKGLWIIGDTGLGKTTTMFKMLYREIIEHNRSAVIIDGIAFSNECSAAFGDPANTDKRLNKMVAPDILVIDDLSKRLTPATQQGFFAVLDRRVARLRPLIITTNVSGKMLFEGGIDESGKQSKPLIDDPQLAGPMRRRLRQHCTPVIF